MSSRRRRRSFYKMHSLGNDFVVLDRVTAPFELDPREIAAWGDRHTGIGFDQLLTIDPPTDADADFNYGIYNADGSSAEQCGNGTRAVALLARHLKLSRKARLHWQSPAGTIQTHFHSAQQIETTMTVPELQLQQIPFDPERTDGQAGTGEAYSEWSLSGAGHTFPVTPISMGNPHGVLFQDDIFDLDVAGIGAALTAHPAFPQGANIGFCQVIDRQFVRLRVFERGVGETRACGSGACAAVVAARLHDLVNERVKVSLPGGKLRITWSGPGEQVTMSGSATLVFRGELHEQP